MYGESIQIGGKIKHKHESKIDRANPTPSYQIRVVTCIPSPSTPIPNTQCYDGPMFFPISRSLPSQHVPKTIVSGIHLPGQFVQ